MTNDTCEPGVSTEQCPPGPSAGLIAGLVVFFLLVAMAVLAGVALAVYVRRGGRIPWPLDRMRAQGHGKAEDGVPATEQRAAPHQYTTMGPVPSDGGHNAIYENYSGPSGQTRTPAEDGHMYPPGPEEDLYCQCDADDDDAIYGNDPACSLAMLPEPHLEDDLYIMPDV